MFSCKIHLCLCCIRSSHLVLFLLLSPAHCLYILLLVRIFLRSTYTHTHMYMRRRTVSLSFSRTWKYTPVSIVFFFLHFLQRGTWQIRSRCTYTCRIWDSLFLPVCGGLRCLFFPQAVAYARWCRKMNFCEGMCAKSRLLWKPPGKADFNVGRAHTVCFFIFSRYQCWCEFVAR